MSRGKVQMKLIENLVYPHGVSQEGQGALRFSVMRTSASSLSTLPVASSRKVTCRCTGSRSTSSEPSMSRTFNERNLLKKLFDSDTNKLASF
ncbi:hypothetical protein EUGRSUZ_B01934 [Eucalyptus grandis]|uniref:Uncharacterized protein n=2 Tax=Eucalyptus grandis TaxID=71139 RepID=A0ACC3LRB9_EUCGR|nr:hypothetical protein EUGRSUZ_B01934 [Eucalyptus grandis]